MNEIQQILIRLENVEKKMDALLNIKEDSTLTAEERDILNESFLHEKEGKLISSKELSKKLKI